MISLEPFYTYDTGNNPTNLSHQTNSGDWQQTLTIHPNSNRGKILKAFLVLNIGERYCQ
jgi:hypothetical protein